MLLLTGQSQRMRKSAIWGLTVLLNFEYDYRLEKILLGTARWVPEDNR